MDITIHKCEAPETGYWAEVPSLPGCVSEGETLAEVRRNIVDAAMGCLEASLRWAAKRAPAPSKCRTAKKELTFA
jgi:predicted RNase H-like HicB family nuclease